MRGTRRLVWWAPRIGGIVMGGFLALFALDVFQGRSVAEAAPDLLRHLVPSFVVLGVVALAWRLEPIGAALFAALAVGYAVMVGWRVDWVVPISGPLALIALLWLASWRLQRTIGAR